MLLPVNSRVILSKNILSLQKQLGKGITLAECPNCKKEISKPKKTWTYGQFEVVAYLCTNCRTDFRVYIHDGKPSFVLKRNKGQFRGYAKT